MDQALSYSYVMQRRDFVALTVALNRGSLWRSLFYVALYYLGVTLMILALLDGHADALGEVVHQIVAGRAPIWIYPLLPIGLLMLAAHPLRVRWIAHRVYPRNALADKELTYRFGSEAIEGGTPEIQARFLWRAVRSIIETPEHTFVTFSRREALIIPRRAFADAEDYAALMAFTRARIAATRPTSA